MARAKVRERGRDIYAAKEKRGHCATCEPTPKKRVSAEELWVRATSAPVPYRVEIAAQEGG